MGLTQKILIFTSALVVALVATSLVFTTAQAESLANENVARGLTQTRQVWETFQADRYNKLKLGIRVLGNDPFFKSVVETADAATILDTLQERNEEIKADFFIVTDPAGVVVARTDRPGAQGEDLSTAAIVAGPLEGEESATVWRSSDRLYHAVSVPMVTGPEIKGVLVAGYGINEALAGQIRNLTHSEIAYLTRGGGAAPQLSVSSLGPKEPALRAALDRPELAGGGEAPFEIDLDGESHVGVQVPLTTAGGETVGSVVALRSKDAEMAGFRRFRNSLVIVSLIVMTVGLGVAFLAARRITGPVRRLADLVERARNGSYSGKVNVESGDEIGALSRTFNRLLAELREKQQMIEFLREGVTAMKKSAAGVTRPSASGDTMTETAALPASALPSAAIHRGDLFASRYDILSTLGKGGMGVVYRAHDRQLDEEVALKVLRPDVMKDDPTLLERFKQEIKLARRITHRNVLRTHDFGETAGTPYISMEYLEGVTLKDLIVSKGALPIGVGLRIARQMAQGLEAAHAQGVVHRDIKPQNMLILPETGDLKVMDFGIARVSGVKKGEAAGASGLTTAGMVMGTPDYMPPEQAQGAQADFRSDVYSLAVVLFEVFTGRLPFVADTMMKVVMAHIQAVPPSPRSINPAIPPALEGVILRGLEKDPARRYPTVTEMLKDLGDVSGEADSATAA
ncbi:MAG TPA: protein kinase [Vicinamibacteria bacterium]|nr:protein kinase [Vicinamibacteria bacterium]